MNAMIQLTRWSSLSLFGNSFLARLVLVTPVVALYVRLQEDYLERTFGLTHAVWLYWSLILISAGQIIFAWRCPVLIKKYGRDVERFKVEDHSARTDAGRNVLKRDFVRSFFNEHGGVLVAPQFENEHDAQRFLTSNNPNGNLQRLGEPLVRFHQQFIHSGGSSFGFNVGAIKTIINQSPGALAENHETPEAKNALWRILQIADAAAHDQASHTDGREWTIMALDWEFDFADKDRVVSRLMVAFLYGAGMVYFLYSGLRGVWLMSQYSISLFLGTVT